MPKGPSRGAGARPSTEVDLADQIEAVRQEMFAAAENLEFEKAARLRDQLRLLKGAEGVAEVMAAEAPRKPTRGGKRAAKPEPMALKTAASGGRGRGRGRGRS